MPLLTFENGTICVTILIVTQLLYRHISSYLRDYLTKRDTILNDLPNLGKQRGKDERIKGTAIVCGGSIAGLWAARVLADHFEDVLIIEAENWLESEEAISNVYDGEGIEISGRRLHTRTRVRQYDATHGMHWFTYMTLKILCPNLDEEVKNFDGRIGPHQYNIHYLGEKILQAPKLSDGRYPLSFFLSREALERMVRRLFLKDRPSIRWMSGVVKGVDTAEDDLDRLTSVTVCLTDNSEITVAASLIADCTGSTQAGLKWLKRLQSPTDKTVNGKLSLNDIRLSYSTQQNSRCFRFYVPPEARSRLPIPGGYDNAGSLYAFMPFFGNGQKAFSCDRIEGHRIRLLTVVWGDQSLPDWSDVNNFCRTASPDGTELVPEWFLEVLDILLTYQDHVEYSDIKYPVLSWIQYEQAAYIPSNFIALGDSVMQPNPTFGQGIPKAIVSAITLDKILRSSWMTDEKSIPSGFSRTYMTEQAQRTRSAWDGSKPIDYLFPSTIPVKGEKRSDEFFNARMALTLLLLSKKDEQIRELLFHTFAFTASPVLVLQPSILFKVFLFRIKQYFGLFPEFPRPDMSQ